MRREIDGDEYEREKKEENKKVRGDDEKKEEVRRERDGGEYEKVEKEKNGVYFCPEEMRLRRQMVFFHFVNHKNQF